VDHAVRFVGEGLVYKWLTRAYDRVEVIFLTLEDTLDCSTTLAVAFVSLEFLVRNLSLVRDLSPVSYRLRYRRSYRLVVLFDFNGLKALSFYFFGLECCWQHTGSKVACHERLKLQEACRVVHDCTQVIDLIAKDLNFKLLLRHPRRHSISQA
jgi:hypothetical protein